LTARAARAGKAGRGKAKAGVKAATGASRSSARAPGLDAQHQHRGARRHRPGAWGKPMVPIAIASRKETHPPHVAASGTTQGAPWGPAAAKGKGEDAQPKKRRAQKNLRDSESVSVRGIRGGAYILVKANCVNERPRG
jgi:hypothetical protein